MNERLPAIPPFLYGTAWKEDDTERLTRLALESGFRGIDTANQRKHYFEAGVGAAVAAAIRDGLVRREELFLQTKFTYRRGQDSRLPYDPMADIGTQVQQSFERSLEHLQVAAIDSFVLHGPSRGRGLSADDHEAWQAMEKLPVRFLGISNVSLEQLELLCASVRVRPTFVQNRCFASTRWDAAVRAFCRQQGIIYQGFSLLTANVTELRSSRFREVVKRNGRTPAQVVFRFAMQAGILPLTGTDDPEHMREDLAAGDFTLAGEDVKAIENVAGGV
jgi:diketogulonate reductase-like aldo/keto reductase